MSCFTGASLLMSCMGAILTRLNGRGGKELFQPLPRLEVLCGWHICTVDEALQHVILERRHPRRPDRHPRCGISKFLRRQIRQGPSPRLRLGRGGSPIPVVSDRHPCCGISKFLRRQIRQGPSPQLRLGRGGSPIPVVCADRGAAPRAYVPAWRRRLLLHAKSGATLREEFFHGRASVARRRARVPCC